MPSRRATPLGCAAEKDSTYTRCLSPEHIGDPTRRILRPLVVRFDLLPSCSILLLAAFFPISSQPQHLLPPTQVPPSSHCQEHKRPPTAQSSHYRRPEHPLIFLVSPHPKSIMSNYLLLVLLVLGLSMVGAVPQTVADPPRRLSS